MYCKVKLIAKSELAKGLQQLKMIPQVELLSFRQLTVKFIGL
jgi:hypothetical protein